MPRFQAPLTITMHRAQVLRKHRNINHKCTLDGAGEREGVAVAADPTRLSRHAPIPWASAAIIVTDEPRVTEA